MRKLLVPIVSAAALLALAACGSGSGSTAPSSSGATGASGDPIVIAVVQPQTGPVALSAEQIINTVKMQADAINAAGGVAGRPIEIRAYDSKLEPETAVKEAQRAVTEDGAVAIIGPYTTSEALAVNEALDRQGVVTMGNSAATEAVTAGKPYAFRVAPLSGDLAKAMMQMATQLGATSGALLYDSGGFGLGAQPLIEAAATEAGVTLESVQYPINASDVTAQVAKAKSSGAESVFIAGSAAADYGLIAKAMAEQNFLVPLIGFSPIVVPDAIKIAGKAYESMPGVYTLTTVDPSKPQYMDLLKQYSAAYGETTQLSEQPTQAFDALNLLVAGLKVTGGEGGEALAKALAALPATSDGAGGAVGSTQQFTAESHDAYKGPYLVPLKVVNGKAQPDTSLKVG